MNPQVWWYVSRATGIVAWVAAMASVLWGLALASRMTGRRPGPAWLLDLHRHLGAITVLFTVAHLAALVADSWVHFDVVDLLVPFASEWKPGPVALGVVAFWLFLAVEVTSLLKRRLQAMSWRAVHLTSYLGAIASTMHYVTAGTDARHPFLRWGPTAVVSLAVVFLVFRLLVPRARRTPAGA